MKTVDLPEKEKKIYSKIRRKYKVSLDPFRVRDKEVQIVQVMDIAPLLEGKDPFKDVSSFPFWSRIWEAAIVLADLIASIPPEKPGHSLLELGAGLAAPGLVAAACGYEVTLSDYESHILDFQRVSAAASGLKGVSHRLIDWKNPPDIPRFDTIIGAEILFREDFFDPLLAVFDKLLAPTGTIYLAHDVRRKSLPQFLLKAENKFDIAVSTRKLRSEGEEKTIIVNRMLPRTDQSS